MRKTQPLQTPLCAALAGGSERAIEFVRWRGDAEQSECWSRSQLARAVERAADAVRRRTAPGDRVIVALTLGLPFVAAFLGCLAGDRIAVPAQAPLTARTRDMVERLRTHTDAALVLTEAVECKAQAVPAPSRNQPIAYLQFTSGSTQAPRGAVVTYDALQANIAAIAEAWVLGPDDRGVFWLPPFHDMGLVGAILTPLACGFPTTLMHPAAFLQRPRRWLDLIASRRATFSGAPNFAYDLCAEKAETNADLSAWRVAVNGAEPVSATTLRRFATTFAPNGFRPTAMAPGYGLAESVLFATARRCDAPAPAGQSPVSCGTPGRGVTVRIVDEERGMALADGEPGAIWLAGPSVAAGYWGAPDSSTFTARLPGDSRPYLRTGDIGFLRDGELFVCGRAKDVIVRNGRKAHASDIEHAIAARFGARTRCAVFADIEGGHERLVVVHELAASDSARTVRAGIVEALGAACELVADHIILTRPGAICMTSSGKVARAATREAWRAGAICEFAP